MQTEHQSNRYCTFHSFLLDGSTCITNDVSINHCNWDYGVPLQDWTEERNLFDIDSDELHRSVPLSFVFSSILYGSNWDDFAKHIEDVTHIWLIEDEPVNDNRIIAGYREAVVKAFVFRITKSGKEAIILKP